MKKAIFGLSVVLTINLASLKAQNIASVEVSEMLMVYNRLAQNVNASAAFAYGFDYHDNWHTRIAPAFVYCTGYRRSFYALEKISRWHWMIFSFNVEQRYYYNMFKRQAKEKNTMLKSADYIGIKPSISYHRPLTEHVFDETTYSCAVFWGLRRAMNHRFYFDGNIGIVPVYHARHKYWSYPFFVNACIGFRLF